MCVYPNLKQEANMADHELPTEYDAIVLGTGEFLACCQTAPGHKGTTTIKAQPYGYRKRAISVHAYVFFIEITLQWKLK